MIDEDVTGLIRRALAAVDGAGTPDDLREPAFVAALAMLSGRESPVALGKSQAVSSAPTVPAALLSAPDNETLVGKIASGLEIEPAKVAQLFAEQNGEPVLIVKSSMLPKTTSAAACDLALMVMAARQLSGVDEYTDPDVLRELAKKYGKFDSANFAASLKSLDNLILTDGKGMATKRKLTVPGVEAAAVLVKRYLGEE